MLVACSPMMAFGLVTGDSPSDASTVTFLAMLIPPVVLGILALYRSVVYVWSGHKRVKALGEAEGRET